MATPRDRTQTTASVRLQLAQEAARLGYWDLDVATQRVEWDDGCAALFGLAVGDFEGTLEAFDRLCHLDDVERVHDVLAATRAGQALEVAYRAVLPDGSVRHLLSRGKGVAGPDGALERIVGVVLDVSELQGALEREQRAAHQLAGLARVALEMAAAQTDDDLTRIVIAQGAGVLGADGGAVCVRDDARGVVRLAMSDSLGEQAQLDYSELPLDGPLPGSYTARTGEPVWLPDRESGLAFTPAMQVVYDGTGREAWAVLPLRSAHRLLGSLVVSWTAPRAFRPDEVELLSAFAAQTAQALDRIQVRQAERRQAQEARRLAESLQRSLLTSPPQPERLQVAVRYSPAAQEAAVGGDWYDAFLTPDGALCLVIGDCVGHDRQAAAAMATMRNLLRATAYTVEEPPAAVLQALERTMRGLDVDVLATALLARVEQRDDRGRSLVWSNAGHLPPVLRLDDGTTRLLTGPPDLLLGLGEQERSDCRVEVPEGATLLLCTDGLVERRGEDLDVGLERLRALVAELGDQPLEHLCDGLLTALLPADAEDDVALLAVRFHSEPVATTGRVERSLVLPPVALSAREARRFLTRLLDEVGRPEWRESAELAVSEIVTNAVLHAHTSMTVTAAVGPSSLHVEVYDDNPSPPSLSGYDEQATTGRGMSLVAAVTQVHGVRAVGSGKSVWFSVGDGVVEHAPEPDLVPAAPTGNRVVVLRGLPPTLWLAARQHHDALLRELAMHRASTQGGTADLAEADRARTCVSRALDAALDEARRVGLARQPLPAGHPVRLEEVPPTVDLELVLGVEAGADFAAFQNLVDEAEDMARRDRLLVRPGLPEVAAVCDWACEQVIAQLSGVVPAPWSGADAERWTTLVDDDVAPALRWDASVVTDSPHGVVAADDANRIVAISPSLADLLGWRPEELVGRRVVALVPHRYREAHVAGFTRHLTTGEAHALGVPLDLPVLTADGGELECWFLIEATGTPSGRTVYLAWITPKP